MIARSSGCNRDVERVMCEKHVVISVVAMKAVVIFVREGIPYVLEMRKYHGSEVG